jgi:hypothetical protein
MKIAVTITVLDKKDDEEALIETTKKLILALPKYFQTEKINYLIEMLTFGIHKNAKRKHTHIGFIFETNNDKIIKCWNKKIGDMIDKVFRDKYDIKISFNDNVEDKDIRNVLAYPLKEYEKNNQILDRQRFMNISEEYLEELRKFANTEYQNVKYKREQEAKRAMIEEESVAHKYEYLDEQLKKYSYLEDITQYQTFKASSIENKLKTIISHLLKYQMLQHKENNKLTFKTNCLMDLAISYLYFRHLISENEIMEYKFRL